MLRLYVAAGVAGAAAVQVLPALPEAPARVAIMAGLAWVCLAVWLWRRPGQAGKAARLRAGLLGMGALVLSFALGAGYAAWRAESRLADELAREHENLVTRLTFQVVGLATADDSGQRFEARVLHAPVAGIPSRILVSWHGGPALYDEDGEPAGAAPRSRQAGPRQAGPRQAFMPVAAPGQIFSAAVVLRRAHGAWNPHSFDFEAWMFERGLRAGATVRGKPRLLGDEPWNHFETAVQRVRHALRAASQPYLEGSRYGAVILALALGDQAGVEKADWETFSRVGITHLVSISGSHVTMLAALAGLAALWGWKRLRWRATPLAEFAPAQLAAAASALLVAWLYCLLAGWGVPAQRTFFMLACVAVAAMLRLPLTPSRVLVAAAALVVALDPWAPLAPGFWLSFGAVAILMLAGVGRWQLPGGGQRWWRGLQAASRLQLAITVALVPLLALQFHEVSLSSPLANALAIPVVSVIVTPMALAGVLLAPLPIIGVAGGWLGYAAERVFAWMMWPVAWLGSAPWSSLPVAAPPWPWVLLACAGVALALQPRGMPGRWPALLLLLPVVLHEPARMPVGGWRLTALDVGQGGAAVIETARHVVVFDSGPPFGKHSDAGDRVVWPYLRARGVRQVDDLVVSHADADHAGGVRSLLERIPVRRLRASYALADSAGQRPAWALCEAGQAWMLDGVLFRFLHPQELAPPAGEKRDTNANSCVLHVQGVRHSLLLPGDIGIAQEKVLLARYGRALRADVVVMAHHGSKTSSAEPFVRGLGAIHAVAQAGYLSRFGHPRPEVLARWVEAGATVHRTDLHGAVVFSSDGDDLRVERQREIKARYWHGR